MIIVKNNLKLGRKGSQEINIKSWEIQREGRNE